jgi:hypothetical protein
MVGCPCIACMYEYLPRWFLVASDVGTSYNELVFEQLTSSYGCEVPADVLTAM